MKYTKAKLLDGIKQGKTYDYFGFWGDRSDNAIERTFSNFYKTKFTTDIHDGRTVTFECSEQYFMFEKALLFKDYEILEKILQPNLTPKQYKALGRAVRGFNGAQWDVVRYNAMLNALRLKYTQNAKLRNYLVSTGDAILVETSPYDRIWGIGLSKRDAWKNPENWKGDNLLGFSLMELRDSLIDSIDEE